MSIDPPKSDKGIPGPIIVLGFVSLLLLVVVAIFGMLAFGIELPGTMEEESAAIDPADVLVSSGFTVIDMATGGQVATLDVEFVVRNTSDERLENVQVLVQCEDGGYASAITMIPEVAAASEQTIRMQLSGTGEPACREPIIAFSSQRESSTE
ncbi:MAG TPA: hypothetical protein VGR29_09120 [Thermomicrobiales bacterium]|nr:hypothetical protein [Thermomicrobiales bacterium]